MLLAAMLTLLAHLQILHGSDEILNAGGDQRNMEQKAIDGFRFAYVGLMHMIEYFRMLFDEINA